MLVRACLILAMCCGALPNVALASFYHVEQYNTFLGLSLSAYRDYAANNSPDYEAFVEGVDFTDDPAGFAGLIPGSSPWPSEVATGQTGTGAAANTDFFARITARFWIDTPDTYTFRTFNDDGVFLFVDGDLVIEDASTHPEQQFTGVKALAAGSHNIELFFFERAGEASLEFAFRDSAGSFDLTGGPSVTMTVVPGPGAGVSLGAALLGALGWRRMQRRRAPARG